MNHDAHVGDVSADFAPRRRTFVTDPTRLAASLAGRYTIDREIGRGGMATVYLARDIKHDRPVALKILNPELGAVLGVERFLAEIRVTANLQHPNLLPLFDSGAIYVGMAGRDGGGCAKGLRERAALGWSAEG
jgi:serine/threonine-protein kinase